MFSVSSIDYGSAANLSQFLAMPIECPQTYLIGADYIFDKQNSPAEPQRQTVK